MQAGPGGTYGQTSQPIYSDGAYGSPSRHYGSSPGVGSAQLAPQQPQVSLGHPAPYGGGYSGTDASGPIGFGGGPEAPGGWNSQQPTQYLNNGTPDEIARNAAARGSVGQMPQFNGGHPGPQGGGYSAQPSNMMQPQWGGLLAMLQRYGQQGQAQPMQPAGTPSWGSGVDPSVASFRYNG